MLGGCKLSAPIDIRSVRNARGGIEEHLLADLTSLMDSVTLSNSGDRWVCDLVSDGNFRVKEIRFVQSEWKMLAHIFFRCDLAQLVLRRICRWWGLDPHDWSSFQECSLGFFRFSSPLGHKVYVGGQGGSSYLGGLSGTLGIGSFLKNLLQDVRKFLML
ncbi:hypothetical protein Tco_1145160 [Tanacetum coccineum]